jgi:Zn-dependent oligopeptidase
VLEKGGSVDADEMLTRFLGREPENTAFLRKLGIE